MLCALAADGERVGVDVERIRAIDPLEFVDVLPPTLWAEIEKESGSLETFFEAWVRFESVAKAEGRGIAESLRELRFQDSSASLDAQAWSVTLFSTLPGYKAAVAVNRVAAEITVREKRPSGLVDEALLRPPSREKLSRDAFGGPCCDNCN